MKFTIRKRKIITSVLILSLLTVMLLTVTACEDFLSGGNTEETTEVNDPSDISTAEEAELAVYRHLLEQADSPEAKLYLACLAHAFWVWLLSRIPDFQG